MTPVEEIPKTLPVYTLAMPPIDVESLIKTVPPGIVKERSFDKSMVNLQTGNQQEVDYLDELEREIDSNDWVM